MKVILDFRCKSTDYVFERIVDNTTKEVRCNCGATAKRLISPVKCQLDGASGGFPGAHYKWTREHEAKKGKCGEGEW
jgi:hypothetical protein